MHKTCVDLQIEKSQLAEQGRQIHDGVVYNLALKNWVTTIQMHQQNSRSADYQQQLK
ncbi:hypothetical protein Nepgr_014138 [Nepenthes gracilis]|uniref:Uncharacterized protein n=1 Tax=Nepenthes gracilis TaxID=150966 RepID=A0AAD3XP93_NEPGR|nr:hypothetical protein Nepgr_014138 [Nepenthes gracilis]